MHIQSLKIPKGYPEDTGLDDVFVDNLKQTVLLVGPNGSGKTRLLNKIRASFMNLPSPVDVVDMKRELPKLEEKENAGEIKIPKKANYKLRLVVPSSNDTLYRRLSQCRDIKKRDVLIVSGEHKERLLLDFVPKSTGLGDPNEIVENKKSDLLKKIHDFDINNINKFSLVLIEDIYRRYWITTHPKSTVSDSEREQAKSNYNRLNSILDSLLGVKISDGPIISPYLFGFPIEKANLSDGQKILLQYAVAFYCKGEEVENSVLILDEPENHLHPSIIVDVISKLAKSAYNGQIWISTHSLPLISHFHKNATILYMENGKVISEGKIQEKILRGIVGDDDKVARQKEFLDLPYVVQFQKYAQECLFPPKVIGKKEGVDPQVNQVAITINSLLEKNNRNPLKTLDYGAGKGRIIANLQQGNTDLDYIAFDKNEDNRIECIKNIENAYGSAENRWYCDTQKLKPDHGLNSFDLILLSNTLHEINPIEWTNLFGPDGRITELLKPEGHLLIIEDQLIPIGEHAHEYGFIVLDTESLMYLFEIKDAGALTVDEKREGRLKAHLVPSKYIANYNHNTLKKSMTNHKKHAENKIQEIRTSSLNLRSKEYAFWVHQYTNTSILLDKLRNI